MNIFSRITASLGASIDRAITKVENHEAIVDAALRETRQASAKARVRHSRVIKDGKALRHKLDETIAMEKKWNERAKQVAATDEEKALECIARRNQCRDFIQQTQKSLESHETLQANLAKSIQQIDNRIQTLMQQRNMMRSRHSVADAMHSVNRVDSDSSWLVDDVLERWESVIIESEYMLDSSEEHDQLDESFNKVEDRNLLKAELHKLLAE